LSLGRLNVVIVVALALVIALLLTLTIRPSAGLNFLAGSLLGAASLGAVTARVWLMTAGRAQGKRLWRTLAALLAIPYYLALAAGLWAVATYYPKEAPWLLLGYILILAAFAVVMVRAGHGLKKSRTLPNSE